MVKKIFLRIKMRYSMPMYLKNCKRFIKKCQAFNFQIFMFLQNLQIHYIKSQKLYIFLYIQYYSRYRDEQYLISILKTYCFEYFKCFLALRAKASEQNASPIFCYPYFRSKRYFDVQKYALRSDEIIF